MDVEQANEAIAESWLLSLHDRAASTRTLYGRHLRWFARWLTEAHRPREAPGDLLGVARADIEAYLADAERSGLAPNTRRNRWVALRTFYSWADDEDEIAANPAAKVKAPPKNVTPVEVLSVDDLAALLKACQGPGFYERRDLALLRLLVATGLRRGEAHALTVADVDLARRLVFVRHGKGDRARVVRFDAATAAAMDRYKRVRARHRLASLPAWWLSTKGPLTADGIRDVINRRAAEAGLGHVHAHQLRHTFAHRFLSAGGNEGDLQRLGGWESAEIMRRYGATQATDRALRAYDEIDPMGGL